MRDIKTYLSVAPVLSTLWFGSLAGPYSWDSVLVGDAPNGTNVVLIGPKPISTS
uniref:Photosystem I reaction center subunit IX n=1 Tax=Nelumbo nucifera TaxID=4432 RepID=A0A822Y636_NELNU|nr:TPA_asm: hypothetical protein HUJ06_030922 [Nelumbo nucifera]